jgi:hypothetical protein
MVVSNTNSILKERYKMSIKERLKNWLGISALANNLCNHINDLSEEVSKLQKEIKEWNDFIGVGVDVHVMTDSWAVFCIAGNREIVKFVNINKDDLETLKKFLREANKHSEHVVTDFHSSMKGIRY